MCSLRPILGYPRIHWYTKTGYPSLLIYRCPAPKRGSSEQIVAVDPTPEWGSIPIYGCHVWAYEMAALPMDITEGDCGESSRRATSRS